MQLTSLRPTADHFCDLLRDTLKIELQKGQMKAVKGFSKTCFSESLIAEELVGEDDENAGAPDAAGKGAGVDLPYQGGLGLKFKFPGDPKKFVFPPILTLDID